ncbi:MULTISPECIES: Hsp20 family protein [Alcanivoracaceae]|uniref:Hsp20 family protein n=3 Tax=Alcanivoracaceae TaxID=224372 RepID=A0A9Q3ZGV6_9GAMM|nr:MULTISPECIES: Hsp20 family protein [Alcanivoracaceae]ARB46371.1 heat-shock protein [Alloalcanivorax xenomutans]KAF0806651.1 heat-shock protein IbpA [Alcanivorax xiamenensis]MCE7507812.1 Hsp20 family protein [Alloalcanivorax xenomutans]MCE7521484.1 Hsp20 family protein [Alloalcanivorax xenomutans]MCU5783989.1 heat-shock protein IbpA [Alloalcanivorax balearicus MACL04]
MNTLAPLFRHSVGFDRFDEWLDGLRSDQSGGYPPYDIIRDADGRYQVVMAVAGFREAELTVTVQENVLRITGKPGAEEQQGRTWLHRGIARRAFERTFRLADHVQVDSAALNDGLLVVHLKRVVPESEKARQVPINKD